MSVVMSVTASDLQCHSLRDLAELVTCKCVRAYYSDQHSLLSSISKAWVCYVTKICILQTFSFEDLLNTSIYHVLHNICYVTQYNMVIWFRLNVYYHNFTCFQLKRILVPFVPHSFHFSYKHIVGHFLSQTCVFFLTKSFPKL